MELVIDRDGGPQRFSITPRPGQTVLQALDDVKADQDGTLTYRSACRHGMCGDCTVRIGGRPRLACITLLDDVAVDGVVTVAPLAGLGRIRDLVVDLDPFFEAYEAAKPWLEPKQAPEDAEFRVPPAEVDALDGADRCLACGACASVCPVVQLSGFHFAGPAALLKAGQRLADRRDEADAMRLQFADGVRGVFRCHSAMTCVEACPEGINPARAIGRLRERLWEAG